MEPRLLPRLFTILLLLTLPGWSLHAIHDMRYTLKPEILTPDESEFYGGFQTRWKADGDFLGGFKFGINDRFEFGSRVGIHTLNRLGNLFCLLDLGGKYAIDSSSALQADMLLGINNNRGGGLVLGYARNNWYTSRFQATYESRIGIFDQVTDGNWATIEIGIHPQFRIAEPVALRMGLLSITDLRNPVDHFQLDLLPGLLVGVLSNLQVFGECGVGIIGDNGVRLSLMGIGHF